MRSLCCRREDAGGTDQGLSVRFIKKRGIVPKLFLKLTDDSLGFSHHPSPIAWTRRHGATAKGSCDLVRALDRDSDSVQRSPHDSRVRRSSRSLRAIDHSDTWRDVQPSCRIAVLTAATFTATRCEEVAISWTRVGSRWTRAESAGDCPAIACN